MHKLNKMLNRVLYYFRIPDHIDRYDLWINEIGQVCHESTDYLQESLEIVQTYYKLAHYYGFEKREHYYNRVIRIIQSELSFRKELYYMDRQLYRRIYKK
jgi:hypothetical protein